MPHLFVSRQRLHHPARDKSDFAAHLRWETINAVCYLIGGLVFIVGSLGFLPALASSYDLGAAVFVAGSLIYLVVTGHDMLEVLHNRRAGDLSHQFALELVAAIAYLAGTVLFTVGSVFFLSVVGLFGAATWLFIVGSLLFVLGACINVLQVVRARSLRILQLMNLTAVSFVVGSVLFAAASVPYLWTLSTPSDRLTLFSYSAWEYVIGSALFLIGGAFNFHRARLVWAEEMAGPARGGQEP